VVELRPVQKFNTMKYIVSDNSLLSTGPKTYFINNILIIGEIKPGFDNCLNDACDISLYFSVYQGNYVGDLLT